MSRDDEREGDAGEGGPGESGLVRVNFGRPMPLFPLNVVTLMPHAVLPVHIFEERYRQMVGDALDGAGQIAMAVFRGEGWREQYEGAPPIRDAVCIGQIVQHTTLPDGRYYIALHGVCRARVLEELPPDGRTMYRRAMLEPLGLPGPDERGLEPRRKRLRALLAGTRLKELTEAGNIVEHLDNEEVPTSALFELISFTLLSDNELRYRLLAEPDASRRADLIEADLDAIRRLLDRAAPQVKPDQPKGVSDN